MENIGMGNRIDLVENLFTNEQAWYYKLLPFKIEKGCVWLYGVENFSLSDTVEELSVLFGNEVVIEDCEVEKLMQLLTERYGKPENQIKEQDSVDEQFLDRLIIDAIDRKASDIHFEPSSGFVRIRFRCDGYLREIYRIGADHYPFIVNRLKIRARLDISEKRLPQDGRILFAEQRHNIDIRISVLPLIEGEKVVLRLLGTSASHLNLNKLCFTERQLDVYREGISGGQGIILISGPTGSGKTTTLYATLKELNYPDVNITTIEDPVEYTLEGVNQVQVNDRIGMSFAGALRSFLRQDPDIIMLGEIRDNETAQLAIRAALTGHLVLSTIHANSAHATIDRLVDMGIRPWLIYQTLKISLAQRLVRLLCIECRQCIKFDPDRFPSQFNPEKKPEYQYVAVGCKVCGHTGYKGRKALFEMVPIYKKQPTNSRDQTLSIPDTDSLLQLGSLKTNGYELFCNGETTLDEIYFMLV